LENAFFLQVWSKLPKARSSKNNFNFSMVGAKWMDVKILKNSSIIQTAFIIRLFCLVPVFFLISPPLSGQQQEIEQPFKYLANVSLVPSKLRVAQDSIEFSSFWEIACKLRGIGQTA